MPMVYDPYAIKHYAGDARPGEVFFHQNGEITARIPRIVSGYWELEPVTPTQKNGNTYVRTFTSPYIANYFTVTVTVTPTDVYIHGRWHND